MNLTDEEKREVSETIVEVAEALRVLAIGLRAMEHTATPETLTGAAGMADILADRLMAAGEVF